MTYNHCNMSISQTGYCILSHVQCKQNVNRRICGLQSGIEGTDDLEEDVEECMEGHRNSVVDMNKIRNQVRVAERGERKV